MSQGQHQFSLRTTLSVITATAVFLALAKSGLYGWRDVLVCASCLPIVIGLFQQARGIRKSLRHLPVIHREVRFSWMIAEFWRYGVAVGLVVYWIGVGVAASIFTDQAQLRNEYQFQSWSAAIRFLLMTFGLAGTFAGVASTTLRSRFGKTLDWVGCVGAVALAAWLLCNAALIPALVHIAIRGIVNAQVYRSAGTVIQGVDVVQYEIIRDRLRIVSYASAVLAVLAVLVLLSILRKRNSRTGRLWFAWVTAVIPAIGFGTWMHLSGFAMISPLLAQSPLEYPRLVGICSFIAGGLFCAAAVWNSYCRQDSSGNESILHWHGERRFGMHELRAAGVLTAVSVLVWLMPFEYYLFDDSANLLGIVAIWLAVRVVFLSPTPHRVSVMERLPIVAVGELVRSFAALALTLLAVVEAVKWSSFMLWMS